MNLIELLLTVTDELESHGVVYALTGSIASSLYGQPLPSLDADLALRMTPAQARDVSRSLSSRFYVSEEALVDAAARGAMANVIDGSSGFKIDLSVLPHTPFYDEVLRRRQRLALADQPAKAIWICSPEDVLLMKLVWRRDTQSEKQLRDARNIAAGQGPRLDWRYITRWATELGVAAELPALRRDTGG